MSLSTKVRLDLIRYANCWEDADLLLASMGGQNGKKLFTIASAGDNALALLTLGCQVHAVDVSEVQLYLAELKRACFIKLDHSELLAFLGVLACEHRIKYYRQVKEILSPSARRFWDQNKKLIENGVVHSGKFENYFQKFRRYFLPLVHSERTIKTLLSEKSDQDQKKFYTLRWNNRRWQLLMRIFFSRAVMGRFGRDPEFLKHVDIPVSQYIGERAEAHLRSAACTSNYFLHLIFTGGFGAQLPFYLRQENFERIRSQIHQLSLSCQPADEAVRQKPYDAYCFSNIFEYMALQEFEKLSAAWSSFIPSGARLAYWNLMAPRCFSESHPDCYGKMKTAAADLVDKGFFYSRFLTDERR